MKKIDATFHGLPQLVIITVITIIAHVNGMLSTSKIIECVSVRVIATILTAVNSHVSAHQPSE